MQQLNLVELAVVLLTVMTVVDSDSFLSMQTSF